MQSTYALLSQSNWYVRAGMTSLWALVILSVALVLSAAVFTSSALTMAQAQARLVVEPESSEQSFLRFAPEVLPGASELARLLTRSTQEAGIKRFSVSAERETPTAAMVTLDSQGSYEQQKSLLVGLRQSENLTPQTIMLRPDPSGQIVMRAQYRAQ